MHQPDHIIALDIPLPAESDLPEDLQKFFAVCREKLGLVPNVLTAYSHDAEQLRTFSRFYNALMFGESGLSKLEKEMIAVVVSSANHCFYCLTAHGCNVREYSQNPVLGELMVMNYRAADLTARHRAMLDFADKMTTASHAIGESDRQALRDNGFGEKDIWDIANIAGFYNMTNRVANAVDMQPNPEYHKLFR
ncbi:MAG: alkylhydroperoxidase [Proteobacteria bacterium]|nr:MAG: alkylhydroperoxidase [Pseudomonadota bacterium]TDJ65116.1 MAG: alkylhydroperoxidase [Pseudomonadota bacterium]